MPRSNARLCISGDVLELYLFEKPIWYGPGFSRAQAGRRRAAKEVESFDPKDQSSVWRAKSKLRRLVDCNAWKWMNRFTGKPCMPVFVTLTFEENVDIAKEAHHFLKLGMMRLRDRWKDYIPDGPKYLAVPERQKRGALHYHLLIFNLPWIPNIIDDVRNTWGNGFVRVDAVKNPKNVSRYLTKYLAKDLKSGRDFNGKRYFPSRGLHQPVVYRDEKTIANILRTIPSDCVPYIGKPMQNEWLGRIDYRRYETPMVDVLTAFQDVIVPEPTMEAEDKPSPAVAP